jgi:Spy/CpxP family protein refolding chaperone
MLVEGIYDEFGVTLKETFEEIRKTRNFEQMREKMPALRDEKDLLIKDVLNEDQFTEYMALMENNRKQRRERMQQRNNSDDASGQ